MTPDPVANRALLDALDASLPGDAVDRLEHRGQTSLWIARQLLGRDPDTGWCERLERRYAELLDDTSHWRAPPEAAGTLAELQGRGVRLSLLTGNAEGVARLRMDRLGLARYFPPGQGAFGCESEDRVELIRRALSRAGVQPREAVEIGDTPLDVETAHRAGIRSIGFHSPRSTGVELTAAEAVVDSFPDLVPLLTDAA